MEFYLAVIQTAHEVDTVRFNLMWTELIQYGQILLHMGRFNSI